MVFMINLIYGHTKTSLGCINDDLLNINGLQKAYNSRNAAWDTDVVEGYDLAKNSYRKSSISLQT